MWILWVDDRPENNAFMVERLNSKCIDVVICKTSQGALSDLARMKFDLCISDMERLEEGREVADAGMRLLEKLKSDSPDLPFVFFTSSRSIARYRKQALELGAIDMIKSGMELYRILSSIRLKRR
jgi:CheY-like chemotaxis protein